MLQSVTSRSEMRDTMKEWNERKRMSWFTRGIVFFALFFLVFPITSHVSFAAEEDSAIVYGDVNGDLAVAADDALLTLKSVVKLTTLDAQAFVRADVDGDESITATDALLILKHVVKLIDQFPAEELPVTTPEPTTEPFRASGVVWIAGDSIASKHDKPEYQVPIHGWGEYFGEYMTETAVVHNQARSGQSSKSFSSLNNCREILRNIDKGDYLLISFGLNDEKSQPPGLYTSPFEDSSVEESFAYYLKEYYIEPALEAGAKPILISPIARAHFKNGAVATQSQTAYAERMELLVQEYADKGITIGYIDLLEMSIQWYTELGQAGTMSMHGVDENGGADGTHLSEAGAKEVCKMLTQEMKNQKMEIREFLK